MNSFPVSSSVTLIKYWRMSPLWSAGKGSLHDRKKPVEVIMEIEKSRGAVLGTEWLEKIMYMHLRW